MCQKKPGLRCSKHANQANKRAAEKVNKLSQKKNKTLEDIHTLEGARRSHEYYNDLYFASPSVFKMLNKSSKRYKEISDLNKIFKKALYNTHDFDNEIPVKVGNFVIFNKNKVMKNNKSKNIVVYKNKKEKFYMLWSEQNPYSITTINNNGEILNIESINPKTQAYGFENQKHPDSRWAIWYTYKKHNTQ